LATVAGLAAGGGDRLLQPVDDDSGWLLRLEPGRLEVEHAGRTTTLRLRRGESMDTVAETSRGWIAAGGRETGDGARRLVLLASDGVSSQRITPPAASPSSISLRPALLVEHGDLVGMAWLEGEEPRRLEVRAALWEGDAWGVPETVAGPAAGSQTALSGAVLADGSWLLAWSAYDGSDDEILWSLRRGAAWTTPRRLHSANEVPDITPALVADGAGALLAWSRLQGDEYASVLARFDGSRWSPERQVTGPGSFYPSFHRASGRIHLLLRNALPRGWAVLELAPGGEAQRHALFPTASAARPAVSANGGGQVTLTWPGSARGTAPWERVR
jgi:hypothetical protein